MFNASKTERENESDLEFQDIDSGMNDEDRQTMYGHSSRDGNPQGARKENDGPVRLQDIELPSGLNERYLKCILGVFLAAVGTIVLLAVYKTFQCCIGFVVAGALLYMAISLKLDYAADKIKELAVICTSVVKPHGTNVTKVVFRTNDEVPTYYEFLVSGASKNLFSPNIVYVIYFREDSPKHLLAHIQM